MGDLWFTFQAMAHPSMLKDLNITKDTDKHVALSRVLTMVEDLKEQLDYRLRHAPRVRRLCERTTAWRGRKCSIG
jgi:hypothetical protein